MKKWILILATSIVLTGCVSVTRVDQEAIEYREDTRSGGKYINEEMKKVIGEINKLRDKDKNNIDEIDYEYLYIDIDDINSHRMDEIVYGNNDYYGEDYFNDLVEILDTSVSPGLKEYVNKMKNKDLDINDEGESIVAEEGRSLVYSEKIGKSIVYVSDRGEEENHISIKIDFFDVENEYYKKIFDEISDGKYILGDLILGEDLSLMDFSNIVNIHNDYNAEKVKIRYNIFFKEKNIEKVNILLQGKNELDIKYEDIEVFTNLLDKLDLNKGEKENLIKEYREIFKSNQSKKEKLLENYNLYINYKKGNTFSGRPEELRYFSIEKK